jgi:hypothetical protein
MLKAQWNQELMYDMPLIHPSLYLCHLAMAQTSGRRQHWTAFPGAEAPGYCRDVPPGQRLTSNQVTFRGAPATPRQMHGCAPEQLPRATSIIGAIPAASLDW